MLHQIIVIVALHLQLKVVADLLSEDTAPTADGLIMPLVIAHSLFFLLVGGCYRNCLYSFV
jgi:hypothetical protein